MAMRFWEGPRLILVESSPTQQTGCGCCGCLLAPFLIFSLLLLRCALWFATRLLNRIEKDARGRWF
jgi:hypothetical protein